MYSMHHVDSAQMVKRARHLSDGVWHGPTPSLFTAICLVGRETQAALVHRFLPSAPRRDFPGPQTRDLDGEFNCNKGQLPYQKYARSLELLTCRHLGQSD